MINFVLITIILVLMPMPITISYVNAGGPRLDYDERYEDIPGAPECWVDGYDAGFAGDYDRNRADECKDIPGDQYNRSWPYGCKDGGLTEGECNEIKSDPDDNINHESLQEENRRNCYDDGYEDGKNSNSFNNDRDSGCSEYSNSYQTGFKAGCQSVEGNTADTCELTIKGHEWYCPNRPDDPSCSEFLHDPSNKKTPSPYGLCAKQPYHPSCPQITDPERYCLTTDDQAFCRTIGDICDADGFVKAEDAYCTDT
jgi:hypothetical protein